MNVPKQKYANQKPPYWYRQEGAVRIVVVDPRNHHLNVTNTLISGEGRISIPVRCPEHGCDFHRMVKLMDYLKIGR